MHVTKYVPQMYGCSGFTAGKFSLTHYYKALLLSSKRKYANTSFQAEGRTLDCSLAQQKKHHLIWAKLPLPLGLMEFVPLWI
jgi:hypothetical protein